MPTERIAMRRVREMLRLSRDAGLATREVARRTGVAPSTLREMFRRSERSGLAWPLPLDLTDADLGEQAKVDGAMHQVGFEVALAMAPRRLVGLQPLQQRHHGNARGRQDRQGWPSRQAIGQYCGRAGQNRAHQGGIRGIPDQA